MKFSTKIKRIIKRNLFFSMSSKVARKRVVKLHPPTLFLIALGVPFMMLIPELFVTRIKGSGVLTPVAYASEVVKVIISEEVVVPEVVQPPVISSPLHPAFKGKEALVARILEVFDGDTDMPAIFMAESSLNPKAMNWNCYYTNASGKRYSTFCQEKDRDQAWSVDCGIAQVNFPGKVCPDQAFDIEWILKQARGKYDRQGKDAWVVYWNGVYRRFL